MRILLILLVIVSFFSSCSNEYKPLEVEFFENDTIPVTEKIKKILESEYLDQLGFNEEQKLWLNAFYTQREYSPLWINDSVLNENGLLIKNALSKCLWLGIPEKRLKFKEKKRKNFVEEEVLLTAKTALISNDINTGFLNLQTKDFKEKIFSSVQFVDSFLTAKDSLSFEKRFLQLGIADTNYRFLANSLFRYCEQYPLDKSTFDIQNIRLDTLHAFSKTKKALISKGYIDTHVKDSLEIVAALKIFQEHNGLKPDGVIGKHTADALNESTYDKVLRAALSLEKLRAGKAYPEKCIRINIPEFKLRLFVKDSLKREHNIIVGKPENQTPELQSKVRTIVVYPYWNVPYSIASKEILPEVKRNVNYLARNNYKIFRGDTEMNPYAVHWKRIKENSFPYKVRQEPGPKNSLGVIKFEFHNNYSVYVHDTPAKYLFKTNIRAYSHGCMRCEDPIDLGKTILDYDSIKRKRNDITADSLDSLLTLEENYSILLKSPIPIFVEYSTVTANKDQIIFHLDIYKRDEEYIKIMKE